MRTRDIAHMLHAKKISALNEHGSLLKMTSQRSDQGDWRPKKNCAHARRGAPRCAYEDCAHARRVLLVPAVFLPVVQGCHATRQRAVSVCTRQRSWRRSHAQEGSGAAGRTFWFPRRRARRLAEQLVQLSHATGWGITLGLSRAIATIKLRGWGLGLTCCLVLLFISSISPDLVTCPA